MKYPTTKSIRVYRTGAAKKVTEKSEINKQQTKPLSWKGFSRHWMRQILRRLVQGRKLLRKMFRKTYVALETSSVTMEQRLSGLQ